MEPRVWPYSLLQPEAEWSEEDRERIDLFRRAYAEGFQTRDEFLCIDLGPSPAGRFVSLLYRGKRNGYELVLGESGGRAQIGPLLGLPQKEFECICARPPFSGAAHFALEWLRGRPLDLILLDYDFVGGSPPGLLLRPDGL